jgi:hypothetical protein
MNAANWWVWALVGLLAVGGLSIVGYLAVGLVRKGFGARVLGAGVPIVAACAVIALFLYAYVGR